MWQCGDMSLARSGVLAIYINIVSDLWDVVRRTKMLDFPAVTGYARRFQQHEGWTQHEDNRSRLHFDRPYRHRR